MRVRRACERILEQKRVSASRSRLAEPLRQLPAAAPRCPRRDARVAQLACRKPERLAGDPGPERRPTMVSPAGSGLRNGRLSGPATRNRRAPDEVHAAVGQYAAAPEGLGAGVPRSQVQVTKSFSPWSGRTRDRPCPEATLCPKIQGRPFGGLRSSCPSTKEAGMEQRLSLITLGVEDVGRAGRSTRRSAGAWTAAWTTRPTTSRSSRRAG